MTTGIVLFGHGARDPRWADTIRALAARVAELSPDTPVEPAFLEFMTPDLAAAVDTLVARGVDAIVVAPVFLAAGGHVLRDLPERLASIATRHPGLAVRVEPALGSLPAVIDAMARHCLDTLSVPAVELPDAAVREAQGAKK
ncbi:MAG: cobalamin biosynthesis protein CbiX [Burkholderiales bacterium]|nr:MAG: cobalamin biosynthesis protein CbiX [Burkholderiales bacterium]